MSSERPAGCRIVVGEFVYESDGEDWTCPSHNHDPVLAFDLLLDRIKELETAFRRHRKGHEALDEFCSICHAALGGDPDEQ